MGIGNIATTGMKSALKNMESIGNNIANSSTIGYKKTEVNFSDIYAGLGGGSQSVGLGTRVQSISQDFSPGRYETTSSVTDLALARDGFFIQRDEFSGGISYTRAGRLHWDRDGYLVGLNGVVQGFPATNGVITSSGTVSDLQIPLTQIPAQATDEVGFELNLDAGSSAIALPFDINDPNTYNFRTDETLYDSLGSSYQASVYYVKTAANTWTAEVAVDGTLIGTGNVTFNTDGSLATAIGLTGLSFNPTSGATTPQTFDITLTGTTQYANDSKLFDHSHNGMTSGSVVSVSIDNDGIVTANYSNQLSRIEGQIAVATFRSNQGLYQSENMSWLPSSESGPAIVNLDNSLGSFINNTIEYSNVDLTEELVKLIGAQHHFQANTQVQQTFNQIMQTIENL